MKILLVNDDGYNAMGIVTLAKALQGSGHQVTVFAPENGCSGDSHAVTFYKPITVRQTSNYPWQCYVVGGHPADCTKIALRHFFKDNLPDLVISGINNGANLGNDLLYSGTASSAVEASNDGVPAIALSGKADSQADFDYFSTLFINNFEYFLSIIDKHSALNVNFSEDRSGDLRAVITQAGEHKYYDYYIIDDSVTPASAKIEGYPIPHPTAEDSDVVWIKKGYTTITPLSTNRTDFGRLKHLKGGNND